MFSFMSPRTRVHDFTVNSVLIIILLLSIRKWEIYASGANALLERKRLKAGKREVKSGGWGGVGMGSGRCGVTCSVKKKACFVVFVAERI